MSKDMLGRPLFVGQPVLAAKGYKGDTKLYHATILEIPQGEPVAIRMSGSHAKVYRDSRDLVVIE